MSETFHPFIIFLPGTHLKKKIKIAKMHLEEQQKLFVATCRNVYAYYMFLLLVIVSLDNAFLCTSKKQEKGLYKLKVTTTNVDDS